MTADVIKAHLDAIEGQLELTTVQVLALRHALAPLFAPKATPSLPERCNGIAEERCALQDDDAKMSRSSFVKTDAWTCKGCRYQDDGPTASTSKNEAPSMGMGPTY